METSLIEKEFNKLKNSQAHVENRDFTENRIKIDQMKHNCIRELAKVTNTDRKDKITSNKYKMIKITECR